MRIKHPFPRSGARFRRNAMSLIAVLIAFLPVVLASCKKDIPADPQVIEAFSKVDAAFAAAMAAPEGSSGYQYQVSGAIEQLISVLGLQQSKYSNPQQKSELKNRTMELAEIFGRAESLGFNAGRADYQSLYTQWLEIRKRLRPFVGSAADAPTAVPQ